MTFTETRLVASHVRLNLRSLRAAHLFAVIAGTFGQQDLAVYAEHRASFLRMLRTAKEQLCDAYRIDCRRGRAPEAYAFYIEAKQILGDLWQALEVEQR